MKVIIWGHKLYSHTSSYVHYGFYRAFMALGHEVLWLDDNDHVSNINFDNCLFITEGQVDKKIPMNNSCRYVLHNCLLDRYTHIKNKINIQFFHNSINDKVVLKGQHESFIAQSKLEKVNNYTFFCKETLYQPWATDLLPGEIDFNTANNEINNRECVFVGSYSTDERAEFENHTNLNPFFDECKKNKISIKIINPWISPVSPEENRRLVNKSFFAPAIQGKWQVAYGYAPPCRLLKNISYGHLGITNNTLANELFDGRLVCDINTSALFSKALEKKNDPNILNDIKFLMNEVKTRHTYINRAQQILAVL